MIMDMVRDSAWKSLLVTRSGLSLSHLFFTNDIVLFVEASVRQIEVVRKCLDEFCAWLGQRVSFAKSHIFLFSNVSSELCHNIEAIVGIPNT